MGSIPGSGRSPGEGNGNPLQYPCLENPVDQGAWWATAHGIVEELDMTKPLSNNLRVHVLSRHNCTVDRQARSSIWLHVGRENKDTFVMSERTMNKPHSLQGSHRGGQLERAKMAWSPSLGTYDLIWKIELRKLEMKPQFCSRLCCSLYWVTLGNLLTISGPVSFFCQMKVIL